MEIKPVLLIFFNRPDTFCRVFEQVRKAKPNKLYLAQDGPRNEGDLDGILKCRRIAENIDWECEVFKNYSDVNLGCGVRPSSAISWALSKEESVIILEDDCVPSISFFRYCSELLEKYKFDTRIGMISGLNHFEYWDCDYSYFFTKSGAIWGWATWARAWQFYDYNLQNFNTVNKKLLFSNINNKRIAKRRIALWEKTYRLTSKEEQISYWDIQWGLIKFLQSQMVIVPKENMITNIGVGATSTHAKKAKNNKNTGFFNISSHEINEIKHPPYMLIDKMYDDRVYKICYPSFFRKNWERFLRIILKK